MSAPEAEKKFREYFPGHSLIKEFMDELQSYILRTPKLDPFKFDDFLHENYGDYEDRGLSMESILEIHYGPQALAFVKGLL
jgi:hypothetical protein